MQPYDSSKMCAWSIYFSTSIRLQTLGMNSGAKTRRNLTKIGRDKYRSPLPAFWYDKGTNSGRVTWSTVAGTEVKGPRVTQQIRR